MAFRRLCSVAGPRRPGGMARRGSVGSRNRAMAVGGMPRAPVPRAPNAAAGADGPPGAKSAAGTKL